MMSSQISRAAVKPSGCVLWITPWERDALQLLANGHTTTQISSCLGLGAFEIERLLARLFAAMDAETQTEAILIAQRRGLLTRESASLDRLLTRFPDRAIERQCVVTPSNVSPP
jgi:DNA-binding CsgD family transcriptional regulator